MSSQLLWFVGDRNPSISDVITVNGAPVDLSALPAQFKMRRAGETALKVNQPVSSKDAQGNWRYDWATTDLDTAGQFLVWVEVTAGGKKQTLWEAIIEVREHGPGDQPSYVELEQFKSTAELTNTSFADQDIQIALQTASRTLDLLCKRRFYPDPDVNQVRYFKPVSSSLVLIDDLITLTTLDTDPDGNGTFDTVWAATDYSLQPWNAVAEGRPYETIATHPSGAYSFPTDYPRAVRVTGKFGWASVPANIQLATTILAAKLLKRIREAPFGFVMAGGLDQGVAMRIARTDPDLPLLLHGYQRAGALFV